VQQQHHQQQEHHEQHQQQQYHQHVSHGSAFVTMLLAQESVLPERSPLGQWQRSVHSAVAAVLPYSRLLLTIISQGLKSASFAGYLWAYKYFYYDIYGDVNDKGMKSTRWTTSFLGWRHSRTVTLMVRLDDDVNRNGDRQAVTGFFDRQAAPLIPPLLLPLHLPPIHTL
jgi:hypothetical protein